MDEKSIGIITIHRIHNLGSVLQTYALWRTLKDHGYSVEIIDYRFPNAFHINSSSDFREEQQGYPKVSFQEKMMKLAYAPSLIHQHKLTDNFLTRAGVKLSEKSYETRDELLSTPPYYKTYVTGSDQVWNPKYTKGDDIFLLSFAPDEAKKISYAASFGTNSLPKTITESYRLMLSRYDHISVREKSGVDILKTHFSIDSKCVLDPTLLLNAGQWKSCLNIDKISNNKGYVFCYFLNYSFDAFPYAEKLAYHIRKRTGLKLIFGGRPPRHLNRHGVKYKVGIGPEEFISLIQGAKLVLSTSFHGTAFAVNFGVPVYSIVNRKTGDDRQASLLDELGLGSRIIQMNSPMPEFDFFNINTDSLQKKLEEKRAESLKYLFESI